MMYSKMFNKQKKSVSLLISAILCLCVIFAVTFNNVWANDPQTGKGYIKITDSSGEGVDASSITLIKDDVPKTIDKAGTDAGFYTIEGDVTANDDLGTLEVKVSGYTITIEHFKLSNDDIYTAEEGEFNPSDNAVRNIKYFSAEANTGLVYTGESQELITVDGLEGENYYHSLDNSTWSKGLAETNANANYSVYVKYEITDEDEISTIKKDAPISVSIGKKTLTLEFSSTPGTSAKWYETISDKYVVKGTGLTDTEKDNIVFSSSKTESVTVTQDQENKLQASISLDKPDSATTISATLSDEVKDNYNLTNAEATFTVEKATISSFAFENSKTKDEVTLNENSEKNKKAVLSAVVKFDTNHDATSEELIKAGLAYKLIGDNTCLASISEGKIYYTTKGNATVQANIAAGDYITSGYSSQYSFEVNYLSLENKLGTTYTLDNGKYSVNTTIDLNKNPKPYYCWKVSGGAQIKALESYSIRKKISEDGWSEWATAITFNTPEATNGIYSADETKFQIKNTNGEISDVLSVVDITLAKDNQAPTSEDVTFKLSNSGNWLNILTFGLFGHENLNIEVQAKDPIASSGIESIELKKGQGQAAEDSTLIQKSGEWNPSAPQSGSDSTEIKKFKIVNTEENDFDDYITVTITDKSGNTINVEATSSNTKFYKGEEAKEILDGKIVLKQTGPFVSDFTVNQTNGINKDKSYTTADDCKVITGDANISVEIQDATSGLKTYKSGQVCEAYKVEIKNPNGEGYIQAPAEKVSIIESIKSEDIGIDTDSHQLTYALEVTNDDLFDTNGKCVVRFTAINNGKAETKKEITLYRDLTIPTIDGFTIVPASANGVSQYEVVKASENKYYYFSKSKATVTIKTSDIANTKEYSSGSKKVFYKFIDEKNNIIKDSEGSKIEGSKDVVDGKITIEMPENVKGYLWVYALDAVNLSTQALKEKATAIVPAKLKSDYDEELISQEGYVHPNGLIIHSANTDAVGVKDTNGGEYLSSKLMKDPGAFVQNANKTTVEPYDGCSTEQIVYNANNGLNYDLSVKDSVAGIKSVETIVKTLGEEISSEKTGTKVDELSKLSSVEDLEENGWTVTKDDDLGIATEATKTISISKEQLAALNTYVYVQVILKDNADNLTYNYYSFRLDKTAPTVDRFDISITRDTLNNLTFGLFGNKQVKVVVTTKDEMPSTGIDPKNETDNIELKGTTQGGSFTVENGSYSENIDNNYIRTTTRTFTLPAEVLTSTNAFEGTLSAIVKDNAGNYNTSGEGEQKVQKAYSATSENTYTYDKDKPINISVQDGYIILETEKPVVEGMGVDKITQINGVNKNSLAMQLPGDNKLYVTGDAVLNFTVSDSNTPIIGASGLNNVRIEYENGNETTEVLTSKHVTIKNSQGTTVTKWNQATSCFDFVKDATAKDNDKYTFEINTTNLKPADDGHMTFKVVAEDNAKNSSDLLAQTIYKDITCATVKEFAFTDPSIFSNKEVYPIQTDYGYYFEKETQVTISAEDVKSNNEITSGLDTITFIVKDIEAGNLSFGNAEEGKTLTGIKIYNYEESQETSGKYTVEPIDGKVEFVLPPNFKGQIYAYATDKLGQSAVEVKKGESGPVHTPDGYLADKVKSMAFAKDEPYKGYVHPAGSIVENETQHTNKSSITIEATNSPSGNEGYTKTYSAEGKGTYDTHGKYDSTENVPLYNGDASFKVTVNDSYSGIGQVSYSVATVDGVELLKSSTTSFDNNQSGTEKDGWTILQKDQNLITDIEQEFKFSKETFNYNDMVLCVEMTDRAGNMSYNYYIFGIDATQPEINVSYDNNEVDFDEKQYGYFKQNRTATIVITERNFDEEAVKDVITSSMGNVPQLSAWVKKDGVAQNQDDRTYTATVTYDYDSDFTFDISCIDRAQNNSKAVDYGESQAPTAFTVDKTAPVMSVGYDNNNVFNGKYFNSGRTATITIVEHNFNPKRVVLTQTASIDGNAFATPSITGWRQSGDTWTTTIPYPSDGDYTFDAQVTDKAGNINNGIGYGSNAAPTDFTVDQTIVKPVISGVENGHAYKDEVIPTITLEDINFDTYELTLTRTRVDEINKDVTAEMMPGISTGDHGGTASFNTFEQKEEIDGIYTITVKMRDKATNESDETCTFTVNRFGSVYKYNDYLANLCKENGKYVKKVDQDLVITEYNPDRLKEGSLKITITKDGKNIDNPKINIQPTVNSSVSIGSSGWFQYTYTLNKSNFEKDGVYKIYASSQDDTGNTSEIIKHKDQQITFYVDSTAPEMTTIKGLEKSIINADNVDVNYEIFDAIGLSKVQVYVDNDQVGKTINDFGKDNNNYKGSFTLNEANQQQNVRIVVTDKAGNVTDTGSNDFNPGYEFNSNVTISTNLFVRFYANKPLFIGTIIVVVLAIGGIGILVAKKREQRFNEEVYGDDEE